MKKEEGFVILTAASEKYVNSLYVLIQSVRRNWSRVIPIHVYNLGLSVEAVAQIRSLVGVEVIKVPEFCEHWRRHYTWKLWIIAHCEYDRFLWMDSGVFVLRSLDGILNAIDESGLFLVPNYQDLSVEAPDASVYACGLTHAQLKGRSSVSANIMGGCTHSPKFIVFKTAYELALNEGNVSAVNDRHRHDQALVSCVLYSKYPDYAFYDGMIYAGWSGPSHANGQVCWGHRRAVLAYDRDQLNRLEGSVVGGYRPLDPRLHTSIFIKMFRVFRGRVGQYIEKGKRLGLR